MGSTYFPDQIHIDRIREALWARDPYGRAAVMVGAGMSRNARSAAVSEGHMPTWKDLVHTIVDRLYPEHGTLTNHRQRQLSDMESAAGALRLAQEYEAAFGRSELDRLIIETVQDHLYKPGELHELLLNLPWSDVLTTNWDTLLERTRDIAVDRHYDVVRTIREIPQCQKPRIVKLHGTIQTNTHLIFTEEDFRTYPILLAPFVNLAQQVIMEGSLCLLGFSGDDPNFLHWSGWVRDHFGDHSPSIYLVGWLELTPARRKMLEARNVTPIDISLHPDFEWPEEVCHQYALHWFLLSLRVPYRDMYWPRPPSLTDVPRHLDPLPLPFQRCPRAEKSSPEHENPGAPGAISDLQAQIAIWRQNRALYPGWVVASRYARNSIWTCTRRWIRRALELLPELDLQERLVVLDELNWRFEICLEPLSAEIRSAIREALMNFKPLLSKTSPEIRRRWVSLGVALLRAAREAGEHAAFEQWHEALREFISLIPWLKAQIAYERCLLALGRFDFKKAESILPEWPLGDEDPMWALRRAAVLASLGRDAEAGDIARNTVIEIRRGYKEKYEIAALSRESCALLVHLAYHSIDQLSSDESLNKIYDRLAKIQAHHCDIREVVNDIKNLLEKDWTSQIHTEETMDFDFKRVRTIPLMSQDVSTRLGPAYEIARLLEITGLPAIGNSRLSGWERLLNRSAESLVAYDFQKAISLFLLGYHPADRSFQHELTRRRIALSSKSLVIELIETLSSAVDFCIGVLRTLQGPGNGAKQSLWSGRLEISMELLSRFVLRLDEDRVLPVLDLAKRLYGDSVISKSTFKLSNTLEHLFRRTMECLRPQTLQSQVLSLALLPVVGLDGFNPVYTDWFDPLSILEEKLAVNNHPVRAKEDGEWSRAVVRLLDAARIEGLYPRSMAVARLSALYRWGLLSEEEREEFARALWKYRLKDDGFPLDVKFYDWAFLELPELEEGKAKTLIRKKYLSASHGDVSDERLYFLNLYYITEFGCFEIGTRDVEYLWRLINDWLDSTIDTPPESDRLWHLSSKSDISKYIVHLIKQAVFPRQSSPSPELARDAWTVIEKLRELKAPVELLLPGLVRLDPGKFTEVTEWLRQSCASLDPEIARAGVSAVYYWHKEGPSLEIETVPVDLVREIGLAVATRRPSNLIDALSLATKMVKDKTPEVDNDFSRFLTVGLSYLLEEACYGHTDQEERKTQDDVQLVRACCVKMALALKEQGLSTISPAIGEWLEQAASDPMTEVRNLVL